MPGELAHAQKRQADAAEQGFDWPDLDGVWAKLAEEIAELQAAGNQAQRCEELGDLMFMVVNLARHLDVEPAAALAAASDKFERRFAHVMATETLP
ncbi:MAG: MazG family protein, partial [Sinobacteraceae bacterium]|nr:MazG family protein [Nevskiaceae bacterium]